MFTMCLNGRTCMMMMIEKNRYNHGRWATVSASCARVGRIVCIGARVGVNEYRGVCHLNVSLSEVSDTYSMMKNI